MTTNNIKVLNRATKYVYEFYTFMHKHNKQFNFEDVALFRDTAIYMAMNLDGLHKTDLHLIEMATLMFYMDNVYDNIIKFGGAPSFAQAIVAIINKTIYSHECYIVHHALHNKHSKKINYHINIRIVRDRFLKFLLCF